MDVKLRLDSKGIAAALRQSGVVSAIAEAGAAVKGNVNSPIAHDGPVEVRLGSRTAAGGRLSARPAATVTLAHPAGLGFEGRNGTLARAASAAGLEVKAR